MKVYEVITQGSRINTLVLGNNLSNARANLRATLGVKALPSSTKVIAPVEPQAMDRFNLLCEFSFQAVKDSFIDPSIDKLSEIAVKARTVQALSIFGNHKEVQKQVDIARNNWHNSQVA